MGCQDCGEENEELIYTICPFAKEVNGTEVDIIVCSDCYRQRVEDV